MVMSVKEIAVVIDTATFVMWLKRDSMFGSGALFSRRCLMIGSGH
jgi:hypothetical protein